MSIGRRIQQARLAAKLSRAELATKLGVSPKTVESWELGASSPPAHRFPNLASTLRRPIGYFFEHQQVTDEEHEDAQTTMRRDHTPHGRAQNIIAENTGRFQMERRFKDHDRAVAEFKDREGIDDAGGAHSDAAHALELLALGEPKVPREARELAKFVESRGLYARGLADKIMALVDVLDRKNSYVELERDAVNLDVNIDDLPRAASFQKRFGKMIYDDALMREAAVIQADLTDRIVLTVMQYPDLGAMTEDDIRAIGAELKTALGEEFEGDPIEPLPEKKSIWSYSLFDAEDKPPASLDRPLVLRTVRRNIVKAFLRSTPILPKKPAISEDA